MFTSVQASPATCISSSAPHDAHLRPDASFFISPGLGGTTAGKSSSRSISCRRGIAGIGDGGLAFNTTASSRRRPKTAKNLFQNRRDLACECSPSDGLFPLDFGFRILPTQETLGDPGSTSGTDDLLMEAVGKKWMVAGRQLRRVFWQSWRESGRFGSPIMDRLDFDTR